MSGVGPPFRICEHCGGGCGATARYGSKYCSRACCDAALSDYRRTRTLRHTGWNPLDLIEIEALEGSGLWDGSNVEIQRLVMRQRDQGGEE